MYYIGVDLGTSAVKLLLMEESGKICNIVSKEYPLFFPHPGWSEQNPEDWFTQSLSLIHIFWKKKENFRMLYLLVLAVVPMQSELSTTLLRTREFA